MSRSRLALRRSSADWTALVEACDRSGLSRAAFAVREGIHPGTFAFWASRLAPKRPKSSRASKAAVSSAFVPVHVRAEESTVGKLVQQVDSSVPNSVEVVLANGRRVRCDLSQVGDPRLAELLALAEGGRGC